MDISNHRDGRSDVHDIALLHQQLFRFGAYRFNDKFIQQLFLIEAGDALIEVDGRYSQSSQLSLLLRSLVAYIVQEVVPGSPGISRSPLRSYAGSYCCYFLSPEVSFNHHL